MKDVPKFQPGEIITVNKRWDSTFYSPVFKDVNNKIMLIVAVLHDRWGTSQYSKIGYIVSPVNGPIQNGINESFIIAIKQ